MDTDVPLGAVLVGLDESAHSARALSWAADEARRRHVPLHLMHVLDDLAWVHLVAEGTPYPMRKVVGDALVMLRDWDPDLKVTWSQRAGDPAARLAIGAQAARMTVIGSHGRGAVSQIVLGSVATELIAETRCPVAVLRADTPLPRPNAPVVVGIGGDKSFTAVLDAAFEEARSRQVDLVVVHTWNVDASTVVDGRELEGLPESEAQRHETALLQRTIATHARSHPDVGVTVHAVHDGAARTLQRYSAGAALLVLGSRGRGEIGGAVLGSVSQDLVRSATCPVLVVRGGRTTMAVAADERPAGARS